MEFSGLSVEEAGGMVLFTESTFVGATLFGLDTSVPFIFDAPELPRLDTSVLPLTFSEVFSGLDTSVLPGLGTSVLSDLGTSELSVLDTSVLSLEFE